MADATKDTKDGTGPATDDFKKAFEAVQRSETDTKSAEAVKVAEDGLNIKDKNGKVIAKVVAADPNSAECDEGIWLEVQADDGTKPTLCLVKTPKKGGLFGSSDWYLGVHRDTNKTGPACDLAVLFTKDGPQLTVTKGKEVKQVSLFDLLTKLSLALLVALLCLGGTAQAGNKADRKIRREAAKHAVPVGQQQPSCWKTDANGKLYHDNTMPWTRAGYSWTDRYKDPEFRKTAYEQNRLYGVPAGD